MPDPLVTPWTGTALRPLPEPGWACFPGLARAAVDPSACSSGAGAAVALWSVALPVPRPLPVVDGLPVLAGAPAVPLPRPPEPSLRPAEPRPV